MILSRFTCEIAYLALASCLTVILLQNNCNGLPHCHRFYLFWNLDCSALVSCVALRSSSSPTCKHIDCSASCILSCDPFRLECTPSGGTCMATANDLQIHAYHMSRLQTVILNS